MTDVSDLDIRNWDVFSLKKHLVISTQIIDRLHLFSLNQLDNWKIGPHLSKDGVAIDAAFKAVIEKWIIFRVNEKFGPSGIWH